MFPDDEAGDERAPRLTHVIYNAALGHVRVRSEDSLPTTVEVPAGEVRFRRVLGAQEPEAALWLDSTECATLQRLLDFALGELRIRAEYQPTLATVQAKVAELAALTTVASQPDGEHGPARGPLVAVPPPPEPPAEPPAVAPAAAASVPAANGQQPLLPAEDLTGAAPPPSERADAPPPARRGQARRGAGRGTEAGATRPPPAQVGAAPTPPPANVETPAAPPSAASDARRPPAPATPRPPAPADGTMAPTPAPDSFDDVWRDLQRLSSAHSTLHALAGQVTSEVREVSPDGIWVYSHGIGREYCVQRDQLEAAWKALTAAGKLVARDLNLSQGAVTLLAHLSYVEYSAQPVTLHYPAETPHPLGTVIRRDTPP